MRWTHARGHFLFEGRPLLMGILNVTPDSFSDGGCFARTDDAVDHALRMLDEGADIIDIGGESTRPGAEPVSYDEECRRVLPVVGGILKSRPGAVLSVDTYKAGVGLRACGAGAAIINDVGGGRWDEEMDMAAVVKEAGAGYICMHALDRPTRMQEHPAYGDVVAEVLAFLKEHKASLLAAGLDAEQLVFDAGLGFGKTVDHNLELIRHAMDFKTLDRPVLWGVSRKSFLYRALGMPPEASRLEAGLAVHAVLLQAGGAQIWRVHEVAAHRRFIDMAAKIV